MGDHVVTGAEEADAGDDRVRAARELREDARRVVGVPRLAVHAPVEDDGRVDAERDAAVPMNGSRLLLRMSTNQLRRVGVGRVVLDVVGSDDIERDRELLEDRAPLRARRGERSAGLACHP